jgi:HlyD family secretion protein
MLASIPVVPAEDGLQVEVRINPPDIDQIALGQEARVKILAFNQRTTPELSGKVSRISADTSRDQQTGATFYTIRVTLPAAEFTRLGPNRISAGMQAEVFVRTEDRTPFEYIVKPLQEQIAKAIPLGQRSSIGSRARRSPPRRPVDLRRNSCN